MPDWWIEMMFWTGWRPVRLVAAANESTLKLLNEKGIPRAGSILTYYYSQEAWPLSSLLAFFFGPMGAALMLRQVGRHPSPAGEGRLFDRDAGLLLAFRTDRRARIAFSMAFATAFVGAFAVNALTTTKAFTAKGLYIVLFVGAIKAAFLGFIAGVAILYLRLRRNGSRAETKT